VTLGGYVLLVGGIVAWLDVRSLGVPAVSVVADMPRNELFGLGLETVAVWLALGIAFTVVLGGAGSIAVDNPVPVFGVFLASVLFVAGFFAIGLISALVLRIGIWVLWILVFAAGAWFVREEIWDFYEGWDAYDGEFSNPLHHSVALLSALAVGVGIGALLGLLVIKPGHFPGGVLTALGSLGAGTWAAGEAVWRRKAREEIARNERRLREAEAVWHKREGARAEVIREGERDWRLERERLGAEQAWTARMRSSGWRSAVAIMLLATLIGWGAVLGRSNHDFWRARVTMTNGTCLAGTLLVHDSSEVLLAGTPSQPLRMIYLPASVVSSAQVIGPPGPPRELRIETCVQAAKAPPGRLAPYPLAGPDGAEANSALAAGGGGVVTVNGDHTVVVRGHEGKQGPEGKQGAEGKEGRKGAQGSLGEQGPQGQRGRVGASGPRGSQGPRGPKGERGPPAPSGIEDGS
jgi:hypothetical protein